MKNSACLVLVQSKSVLISPRCLFELYTACTNEVPVVALDVQVRRFEGCFAKISKMQSKTQIEMVKDMNFKRNFLRVILVNRVPIHIMQKTR